MNRQTDLDSSGRCFVSSRSNSHFGYLLRTSVLYLLADSIGWPVRWSRWDTGSKHSAWALGPSARLMSGKDGGLFAGETRRQVGADQLEELQPMQAKRAANWATSLVHDTTARGSGNRDNPAGGCGCQATEVREASWFTAQARGHKDCSPTHGGRKSPNQGTQVNAAGLTPDGASPTKTAKSKPSRRRSTSGSRREFSPEPGP